MNGDAKPIIDWGKFWPGSGPGFHQKRVKRGEI